MPASHPKDVEPIHDTKVSERYLRYALELNELIACVLEGSDFRFDAVPLSLDLEKTQIEVEIEESFFNSLPAEAIEALDGSDARLRLSYSVHEVLLFAHAKVLNRNARKLLLQMEQPLFKLQRRDALRIKTLLAHEAKVRIDKLQYSVHDISAGGLSIVIGPAELPAFMKGKIRKGCQLRFAKTDAPVTLEITSHHRSRKDGNRFKVGFRFVDLPPAMEQKIAQEAYLQTHQIWSRWL
jgi:hypothetical protein